MRIGAARPAARIAWQTSNPSLRGSMMSRMIRSTGRLRRLFESLVAIAGVLDSVPFVPQAVADEQTESLFVFHQEDTTIHGRTSKPSSLHSACA